VLAGGVVVSVLGACSPSVNENRLGKGEGYAASANAGLPVVARPDTAAAGTVPSAGELDQRERELVLPRPPAGPPLR